MRKILLFLICFFVLVSQSFASGLIGRTGGMRLVTSSTVTAANTQLSLVDGTAFAYFVGVDLSAYQTGKHLLAVYNSSTGLLIGMGYCSATPPAGETLDSELLPNNSFTGTFAVNVPQNWTLQGTQNATNYLEADDAGDRVRIVSGDSSSMGIKQNDVTLLGVSAGMCLKGSVVVDSITGRLRYSGGSGWDTVLAGQAITTSGTKTGYATYPLSGAQSILYLIRTVDYNVDAWISDTSLKQVLDPASTGVRIEATPGGAQNWTTKGSGVVNANISYKIYYVGN